MHEIKSNSIIRRFIAWFFVRVPLYEIPYLARSFMRWAWHYFSIGYLSTRLFSPWHKDLTGYGRGFDLKRIAHVFGWNAISRVLGALMRIVVIIIGLFVEAVIVFFMIWIFVAWYLLPLSVPVIFISGILMIING